MLYGEMVDMLRVKIVIWLIDEFFIASGIRHLNENHSGRGKDSGQYLQRARRRKQMLEDLRTDDEIKIQLFRQFFKHRTNGFPVGMLFYILYAFGGVINGTEIFQATPAQLIQQLSPATADIGNQRVLVCNERGDKISDLLEAYCRLCRFLSGADDMGERIFLC